MRHSYTRRVHRLVAGSAAVLLPALMVAAVPAPALAAPVAGTDVLYTTDAEFDSGVLTSVNHDAPNNNQLQLDEVQTFFPYVNIAASARGTVIRIDVNSGATVGEWRSAPDGRGRNPSRTTVDRFGNTWLSNRDESAGGKGSVTRVGVVSGGTRADADGTANPTGDYLKGPFSYNTCADRDGDGLIATSRGLGDIRPWSNAGGADDDGGVSTAADECIINYTRVNGTNTRTVAVDANNDLWTGGSDTEHEQLSGVTGQPIAGTQIDFGCGGYGGLIDKAGTLWSARFGNNLLRYVPSTGSGACLDTSHGDYGLGMDPTTGEIWHTTLGGGSVVKMAPDGTVLGSFPHGFQFAQGVAVDGAGNVWVAHSLIGGTTVGHLRTDGTFVGNVTLPGGAGPTGVAIDRNGKVWVANLDSNNAMRIDPAAGPVGGGGFAIGAVDLTVDLGPGAGPYNYSDMTGSVLGEITAPVGTWSVVQDGGAAGTQWGKVTWNTEPQGAAPAGTSIVVEARAADAEGDLAAQAFAPVTNGSLFSLTGRYIEVRATLTASGAGASPVLSDIRIETGNRAPECAGATASVAVIWPPNHTFVPVGISGVTDPDGDATTVTVTGIRQDEPVDTTGDGAFVPDGKGVGTPTAEVRAERSGTGNGRVYHIAFSATDGKGGTCTGTVTVAVPHDRDSVAVDGGPLYDSTVA
jgi:streptogramin lyase